MAKFTRHDFGGVLEALNNEIIAEVKAVLSLLPEQKIEGHSLCRIIIGPSDDYSPRNIAVDEVWVDEKKGMLHICGRDLTHENSFDQNWADNVEHDEWTEEDSLYDITDFGYLIDQIAGQVDGDKTINVANKSLMTCGYVAEKSLKSAAERLLTA